MSLSKEYLEHERNSMRLSVKAGLAQIHDEGLRNIIDYDGDFVLSGDLTKVVMPDNDLEGEGRCDF